MGALFFIDRMRKRENFFSNKIIRACNVFTPAKVTVLPGADFGTSETATEAES